MFVQKAKEYLDRKLDKNLYSYALNQNFSNYRTVIFIEVLKSGNHIKIDCCYYDNKINFWNSFDEEFVQPLSEEGLAEILDVALKEKSVEYRFSFVKEGWAGDGVVLKLGEVENGVILKELSKILTDRKMQFDYVLFTDFFGEINIRIEYNRETEKFEICQSTSAVRPPIR